MNIIILTLISYGIAIIILAIYQWIAAKRDQCKYPPIGKLIDIGGYKLHMIDQGYGSPIVIIDAACGNTTLDWSIVQPEIAKFTRVITYDRAGYGWSDQSPLERTSENIVKELHAMLQIAGISSPYILVGHSLGGLNMQLFANTYHTEVAGVVLVASGDEEQFEKMPQVKLPKYIMALYYLGFPRLSQYFPSIKARYNKSVEKYSLEIQKQHFAQKSSPKFMKTVLREDACNKQSCLQLKNAPNYLGEKPLIVISAGKPFTQNESVKLFSQAQIDQSNKNWSEMQSNLIAKSSQSEEIIAENSGHMINYDQPGIVVDAVRKIIDQLCKK